jgi:hypothetical protein
MGRSLPTLKAEGRNDRKQEDSHATQTRHTYLYRKTVKLSTGKRDFLCHRFRTNKQSSQNQRQRKASPTPRHKTDKTRKNRRATNPHQSPFSPPVSAHVKFIRSLRILGKTIPVRRFEIRPSVICACHFLPAFDYFLA